MEMVNVKCEISGVCISRLACFTYILVVSTHFQEFSVKSSPNKISKFCIFYKLLPQFYLTGRHWVPLWCWDS